VPAVKVANGNAPKSKADADSAAEIPEVKQALDLLNGMRRTLHYFLRNQKETNILEELGRNANDLFSKSQIPALYSTNHLALALKTLLDDLNTNKHNINPSSLRTVGQSIDFFATLLDKQNLARIHDVSEAKIFALDDDTGILETVAATMEMVKLKVTTSADPLACLEKLAEENFDMILLDVGLPQMNGLDVCTRVRSLPQHKNTPIVFLTGAATVQNRVQSTLSGGNDLIGKPFSVHELAVKVLTWIYKGQLGLT
jgi:CheY-like chemotaxis protein